MKSSENKNFKFFNIKPIKFLPGIYIYLIIIIIIIIGLIYVYNLNEITTQTASPKLNAQVQKVEKDLPLREARVIPPINVLLFQVPSPDIIAKGKKLFEQRCATCHGNSGKGNGPAREILVLKPRNFTKSTGWKNGLALSEIYKTLEEGIPGSGMESYGYLLPEDKLALGSYIRSVFVPNVPEETGEDLLNLDLNYNLSEGAILPAQIPVKFANKLIISEQNETVKKIKGIIASIKNMNENEGKTLFYEVTDNQFSALVTLNANQDWKKNQKLFIDDVVNNAINNGFNRKRFQLKTKRMLLAK